MAVPLLLAMFSAVVLLDPGEVSQGSGRIVVDARLFRAHVHFLTGRFFVTSLPELPGEVVAAAVQLQILVSLELLLADFAHKTVGGH